MTTAVQRLRGILARDHDAATIDQLLTDVCAELAPAHSVAALAASYTAAERFRAASAAEAACTITEDPDRQPRYTRLCRICGYVTAPWDNAIAADDQIRDHISEVHQDVPDAC